MPADSCNSCRAQQAHARNHGEGARCALPVLQCVDPAHVQRVWRVHLLLAGVRGQGGVALLRGRRVQAAPRLGARGNQALHRGPAHHDAAVGADVAELAVRSALAMDGAAPGRRALPARLARVHAIAHLQQNRVWHVHCAHTRVAVLLRLSATRLLPRQDEPGGNHDARQHGRPRARADGRGGGRPAAAARRGQRERLAAGDLAVGLCCKSERRTSLPRSAVGGAL